MRNHSVVVSVDTLTRLIESFDVLVNFMEGTISREMFTSSEWDHLKRADMLLDDIQRILDANR